MPLEEIWLRLRANLVLKIALSSALTPGIFGTYLLLQRFPLFQVRVISPTGLDRAIPFTPGAVFLYESIWLLTPIGPWLMKSREELGRYTRGLVAISVLAFLVFAIYPTACARPETTVGTNFLYTALVNVDRELNAFSSLHAAFAVFHASCCFAVLSQIAWAGVFRWAIWVWALAIIFSTLLTKQHVVLDAMAGSMLGAAGYVLFCCSHQVH